LIGTGGIVAADCQEVRDASDAVEMNLQPVTGYNPDAALCSGAQTAVSLFFDDLEAGAGNWILGAISGTNRWVYSPSYADFAHSGSGFLYADDLPATTADTTASMNSSTGLPSGAYLHFAHAYGFDEPNADGGVLEYSTNGGASWTDAGSLIDTNGYDGMITSGPLSGRSGFISDSHGYISTRLNLTSLAGQSVRFRWRMGINNGGFDWGWWLDDVRIYICVNADYQVFLPVVLK